MARPLRIEFAGAFHHVMARGNARQSIFRGVPDREAFLGVLKRVCGRFDWRVWAYCLMDNHYHLLVETLEPTLSRGMREINGIYTQTFNRRHARMGHVFQGRYKSLLIDKDAYLLEVSRYIVLNPVKANICRGAADYRWSSYRQTLGQAKAPDWLVVDEVLKLFSRDRRRARQAYRKFVMADGGLVDPFAEAGGGILGDDSFIAKVTRSLKRPSREVPRKQRTWKSLASYAREAKHRNEAIQSAYQSGDFTLAQIGEHFGLHYATVSRIARKA
jgi:REP-associated tyrosine transposase